MTTAIAGVPIPDTKLARETTELVRDTSTELLYHHSRRVYLFGALAGQRRGLVFDAELLYVGAMFHDIGLLSQHSSSTDRFEVDSANAARAFMKARGASEGACDLVWAAIALHTTPGIPQYMQPEVALVTAGVEMDVLGIEYAKVSAVLRSQVTQEHPRSSSFKADIVEAFYQGNKHKPDTTFGNVNADVLALKDPAFRRGNFCSVIEHSAWLG